VPILQLVRLCYLLPLHVLLSLEREYLSADVRKVNEGVLHGEKQEAGRAVWAKELAYLHMEFHEAEHHWAKTLKQARNMTTGGPFLIHPKKERPLLPIWASKSMHVPSMMT